MANQMRLSDGGRAPVRKFSGGGGSFAPAPTRTPMGMQRVSLPTPAPNPYIAQNRQTFAPSPAPAPAYRPPPPVYSAAPAAYTPAPAYAPAPAPYSGGGFSGSGGGFAPAGGGFEPMAAPAPPPPPRQLNEGEWLAGDADYKDQNNEYDRALSEFGRRIAAKKKNFNDDAALSKAATLKNQDTTLGANGEDFAARGLGYSGLFADRQRKTRDSFANQQTNIETNKNRNNANADEEHGDYKSENQLSRGNAKRQALARMAAQQALINAGGAM
jgi:hypothetical protein